MLQSQRALSKTWNEGEAALDWSEGGAGVDVSSPQFHLESDLEESRKSRGQCRSCLNEW